MGNTNATSSSVTNDFTDPKLQIKSAKELHDKIKANHWSKLQAEELKRAQEEDTNRQKLSTALRESIEEAARRMETESSDSVPVKGIADRYSRYIRCDGSATSRATPSDSTYHWDTMVAKLDALGYRLDCHEHPVQPIDSISPYHPDVTLSLK